MVRQGPGERTPGREAEGRGAVLEVSPGVPGTSGHGPAARLSRVTGTLLGCASALAGLVYFAVAGTLLGPLLLWPRTRVAAHRLLVAGARRLAEAERWRRSAFFSDLFPAHRASDEQVLRYLAGRVSSGLLCAVVTALLGFGLVLAGLLAVGVARGTLGWGELPAQVALGSVLLFLDVQGLFSLASLDARLARECFGPDDRELLRRRIGELAASRAAVVRAVDRERRRVERDLHDGVQQRLVALAMLLGRARRARDAERADALLEQAHREAGEVLAELREVAWRVYPTALDSVGLREALGGVAERCPIPVRVAYEVSGELPAPVETAAYFVVSESVNNAAKHSGAEGIVVSVARREGVLAVCVQDDGCGGADPEGGGLAGLRGRVAAIDGMLDVHSPAGGPTTVTAELPCV
ncbi:sensor histidine kinase [Streptomyces drozdowiczii]|uniref:histidine kinase n=1 Tax=Streptomyces drozdowiczii TaxID=202862 RepID=A0ABY6PNQ5_9ACTN|nr:histidine kinase [Streptomyces drozdowiczii]MCX0246692.1 histidine kinase [Streptomyces drozdowiczii]UZK53837.1 histidine kinase [Streptomyces drozdowiczii]